MTLIDNLPKGFFKNMSEEDKKKYLKILENENFQNDKTIPYKQVMFLVILSAFAVFVYILASKNSSFDFVEFVGALALVAFGGWRYIAKQPGFISYNKTPGRYYDITGTKFFMNASDRGSYFGSANAQALNGGCFFLLGLVVLFVIIMPLLF